MTWLPRFCTLALALWFCPGASLSADDSAIRPALATNAEAVAKINALRPNEAAIIGQAKVLGDFNDTARRWDLQKTGPRGRDFTIRMCWAPERRRVLFCGANHGVPHRINDVWEFDLAAMAWVMLYAPDLPRDYTGLGKDFSDIEFKDGLFITKRGGPGIIAHTWWGLTYDHEQKSLLFMNTWVTDQKKAAEQLGGDPGQLYAGPPLWAFTPHTGQWRPLKTEPPYPRPIFGGLLEFIPELRGTIWHANNWQMHGTWLYDAKTNAWKNLQPNASPTDFERESPAPEQVGYYDPARELVIAQRHKETFHFDPAKNLWRKVAAVDKDSDLAPLGHDAYAPLYHDPTSGHGLLIEFKTGTLWSYDPDAVKWTRLTPTGEPVPTGSKLLAYFDPVQKVFVVLRDTTVWAYRYR
ncbi:MAG: hypothetical protein SFU86_20775 [Pirellulaceae bacterium]|nr:hypothetical protein [Pirellulaceae bacterium]